MYLDNMKILLCFLAMSCYALPLHAQYRCMENGKVLFTDRPCESAAPPAAAPSTQTVTSTVDNRTISPKIYSPYSAWHGQVQFQARLNGKVNRAAHEVTPLAMEITPEGKVTGISNETGCRFKGIASPGFTPAMLSLDVTLSGCAYEGYNQRMSGHLSVSNTRGDAALLLSSIHIRTGTSATYELKGTLRP